MHKSFIYVYGMEFLDRPFTSVNKNIHQKKGNVFLKKEQVGRDMWIFLYRNLGVIPG